MSIINGVNPSQCRPMALGDVEDVIRSITGNSGWVDCDGEQAQALLEREVPYTYILRPGKDQFNYSLSFVDDHHAVEHRPVRIEMANGGMVLYNGGCTMGNDIVELVAKAMHCAPRHCVAYQHQAALV